jgi:hypothetical protein
MKTMYVRRIAKINGLGIHRSTCSERRVPSRCKAVPSRRFRSLTVVSPLDRYWAVGHSFGTVNLAKGMGRFASYRR